MRNSFPAYTFEQAAALTTDPAPACGHEDCATLRDTATGEHVTYCGYDTASALETVQAA